MGTAAAAPTKDEDSAETALHSGGAHHGGAHTTAGGGAIHPEQQRHHADLRLRRCCARGREFENRHTNHAFTTSELQTMAGFESMNYLPQNSKAYRKHLRQTAEGTAAADGKRLTDNHWDKWFLMGSVGFLTGVTGYLLKSLTELITEAKYEFVQEALDEHRLGEVFAWVAGIGALMVLVSSGLVVYVAPEAAGSGVPAVIGYLNGVYIHHLYDVRVFVVKFVSTFLAVASGLPVGPEGPMVYMGATLGKHVSQGNTKTCPTATRCCKRFRTMQGRRDFISAGAGAGIASAFGAPVGGMLFSMEEVASFWNLTLGWQIFFCCMVATFTTDLMISSFGGFKYDPERTPVIGTINEESGIIFGVSKKLSVNALIFVPTIFVGLIGGSLGAAFTFLNLKINRLRKQYIEPWKWLRVLEPVVIVILMATIAVFLPANFGCQPTSCEQQVAADGAVFGGCLNAARHPLHAEVGLHRYTCPAPSGTGLTGLDGGHVERMLRALSEEEAGAGGSDANITETR